MQKLLGKIKSLKLRHSASINGFLQLSVLRVLQISMGIVSTYFIAHSLSVEQYGEYQFLLNILGILSVFTLTEFANTLMQSVARGYSGSFLKMLPLPMWTSLIASLVLLGFSAWQWFVLGHSHLALCFLMASLLFPFSYGLVLWRGYLIGKKNFLSYSKTEMLSTMLTQVGMIVLTIVSGNDYIAIFVWFCMIPAIINLFITRRVLREVRDDPSAEDGIIEHGVKSSLYISVSVLANYADKILIFFILGPVSTAIYTAADRIPDLMRVAVQDVATTLAPKFATLDGYSKSLDRYIKYFCLIVGVGLLVFSYFVLPHLIVLIYGQKYSEALPYSQLLIFSVIIGNIASLQFRYIRSKLDTKNVRDIMITTSIVKIIMSVIFIPIWGLAGAVTGSILYRVMMTVFTNHIVHKHYGHSEPERLQP